MWWVVAGLVAAGAGLAGPVMSRVEQAPYHVVSQEGDIEIRDYPPLIVAETEVSGDRNSAASAGFRIIADYIFGNNISASTVAMTAPVIQQAGETIAMTAPVTEQQQGDAGGAWQVRFVMPARYTLETLPKPRNPAVRLRRIAGQRFAVIRFSGLGQDASLREHTAQLQRYLAAHGLVARSAPSYAFYNPPWTLPFLRRNEVRVEIGA
jgi:DNA gyrase inhibitor GyrI